MKLVLLVNSAASSVTPRTRVVIGKALAADHDVTLAETSRRGHATQLARDAAQRADAVVVLGGDGTLNEAANGLAGSDCALAPLPGGSTNVFARTIGMPNDPVEATGALLDALAHGSIRRVGLGTVNDRYFLFHTGIGFDAAVVAQVERRSSLKRYAGHPLFVMASLDTWLRHYDRRRPSMTVSYPPDPDGSTPEAEDAFLTVVLNTNPYTFLGNMPLDLAPGTSLDNGLTAITLQTMSLARTMPIIASSIIRAKGVRSGRWVGAHPDLDRLDAAPLRPILYQVDGDVVGEVGPDDTLRLRHTPDILDLVIPTDTARA